MEYVPFGLLFCIRWEKAIQLGGISRRGLDGREDVSIVTRAIVVVRKFE